MRETFAQARVVSVHHERMREWHAAEALCLGPLWRHTIDADRRSIAAMPQTMACHSGPQTLIQ